MLKHLQSVSFYSPLESQVMPVIARLDWVSRQLQMGRAGHVFVGPAQDPSKLKVEIVLQPPSLGALSASARVGIQSVLTHIRHTAAQNVAVDRGHKNSPGYSEIGIWINLGIYGQIGTSFATANYQKR